MQTRTITSSAGEMPVYYFHTEDSAPLVILLMDAIGVRDELRDLARDIQQQGYNVALPSLYYREGRYEDMDFSDPAVHETIMRLYGSYSHAMAREDIGAVLNTFPQRPVGLLGFCMGGANALVLAGAFASDVAAAAAIHPGGIATRAEDSPHRMAAGAKGELYIAIADEDPYATPEQVDELESSLQAAAVDYRLEVYEGAHHGFSFESLPSFNAGARDRYWRETMALFQRSLS